MLTLYIKSNCAFSAVALKKVEDLALTAEEKNIADAGVADELVEKGGKLQVPYLWDSQTGTGIYDSADIAAYLDAHYGTSEAA